MAAIGINWADIWAPVWGPVWSQTIPEPEPQSSGVGRPKRKRRWAVEQDGELIEFGSAQAAIAYLSRQNKKAKAKPVKSAAPEQPKTIPASAITYDGVPVSKIWVDGTRALDRIKTMRDAEIAMVERHIREIQEEDDLIMQLIGEIA